MDSGGVSRARRSSSKVCTPLPNSSAPTLNMRRFMSRTTPLLSKKHTATGRLSKLSFMEFIPRPPLVC